MKARQVQWSVFERRRKGQGPRRLGLPSVGKHISEVLTHLGLTGLVIFMETESATGALLIWILTSEALEEGISFSHCSSLARSPLPAPRGG